METIVLLTSRDRDILSYILKKIQFKNKRIIVIKCKSKAHITLKWISRKLRKVFKDGLSNWIFERYVFIRINRVLNQFNLNSLTEETTIRGYEYHEFNSVNDSELQNFMRNLKPDVFLSIGNSWISSKTYGSSKLAANLHLTKLPDYSGCIPIVNELLNGEEFIYGTLHNIEKQIDSGDILMETKVSINREFNLNKDIDLNFMCLLNMIISDLENFINSKERKVIRKNGLNRGKIIPKLSKIISYGRLRS